MSCVPSLEEEEEEELDNDEEDADVVEVLPTGMEGCCSSSMAS